MKFIKTMNCFKSAVNNTTSYLNSLVEQRTPKNIMQLERLKKKLQKKEKGNDNQE